MPKPEPRPLRTLPERAFHARARLVAALMCCVCFAGLAARLAYLQLFSGDWYTSRALGQQLRDTVVPADRGRIYSDDGVLLAANSSCWTLRASPREMPEEKLSLAAQGLAEILSWTKRSCWKNSVTAPPTTAFCATAWSATPPTACGIFVKRTASPASASIRTQALVPGGGISGQRAGLYQCRQRRCERTGAEI